MTKKLAAWKKWCKICGMDGTTLALETSSHGKVFSFAWDAGMNAERREIMELSDSYGWIDSSFVWTRNKRTRRKK